MANEPLQTIGELRRKATITDEEISEAVEAYLEDSKLQAFRFASGHVLDVAAAVDAHGPAKAALAKKNTIEAYRRTMVRTAVILATPIAK